MDRFAGLLRAEGGPAPSTSIDGEQRRQPALRLSPFISRI